MAYRSHTSRATPLYQMRSDAQPRGRVHVRVLNTSKRCLRDRTSPPGEVPLHALLQRHLVLRTASMKRGPSGGCFDLLLTGVPARQCGGKVSRKSGWSNPHCRSRHGNRRPRSGAVSRARSRSAHEIPGSLGALGCRVPSGMMKSPACRHPRRPFASWQGRILFWTGVPVKTRTPAVHPGCREGETDGGRWGIRRKRMAGSPSRVTPLAGRRDRPHFSSPRATYACACLVPPRDAQLGSALAYQRDARVME